MKVLILGASGMLGHAMFRYFSKSPELDVCATARTASILKCFPDELSKRIFVGIDAENQDALSRVFSEFKPQLVVNCVGLIKQLEGVDDPLIAIPTNSILPHRLARLCSLINARLVHISTDCVFSGSTGGYCETDRPDVDDLYGHSKLLGEVAYPHTITLRTSIVGHELSSKHGLVEWFLAQEGSVNGFTKAIFSGLPTVELARVVRDFVLPRPNLSGIYHVASSPISKYDLLRLVAHTYEKRIEIVADDKITVNRSLNSTRFRNATGYEAPEWPELVKRMLEFQKRGYYVCR